MTKAEIGNKVRELRIKKGRSQEELGKALTRSHAAVSDIERGKTDLSVSDLYIIANFFQVPVTEFLTTNTAEAPPNFMHARDAKDITPEEQKIADKFGMEFVKYARELANKDK